jgi:hypothetical protein
MMMIMMATPRSTILLAVLLVFSISPAFSFSSSKMPICSFKTTTTTTTRLLASRRTLLSNVFGTTTLLITTTAFTTTVGAPEPAAASYTAYVQREKDWDDRQKQGAVTFSNAKSLRAQLKEIVPQNSEGSKIFCPNGMSSAVSPLQENKCGDQLAMPSVYGRTSDVVGNSVPGVQGGLQRYPTTSSSQLSASDVGGFPKYK